MPNSKNRPSQTKLSGDVDRETHRAEVSGYSLVIGLFN
jgi:hypothetical protein